MPNSELDHLPARNIVLVTGGMDCGGAQRVMADMANYWAEKGWHVTLATWSGADLKDFFPLSPNVSRLWLDTAVRQGSLLGAIRATANRIAKLRRLLRKTRPDAVLSFIDVSNILTVVAGLGLGVHVVISERTHPGLNKTVSRSWRMLRRLCYSWAGQVVAQTQDAAVWLERRCRTVVRVIPNSLRALPEAAMQREPLIIAVGRLSREKGYDILLEAFARVRARFPAWHLRILGEGPERSVLAERVERLGLRDCVELVGQVRNVEDWMARAGIMVHPSRREGFPNAVLEGMGMGAAVICTDCRSGPSELIEDGVNGLLVPVDDVEIMALAMADLMGNSNRREQFGKEAIKVRKFYAQDVVMKKWEACILPQLARERSKSVSDANPASR